MAWEVNIISDKLTDDHAAGASAAVVVLEVISTDPVSDNATFLSANDGAGNAVPAANAAYSGSRPFCRVKTREVDRRNGFAAKITVNFGDPTLGQFATTEDLLAAPAKISVGSDRWMEEYVKDRSNPPKFVRTPAGEPFERGPMRPMGIKTYVVRKFVNATTKAAIEIAELETNSVPKVIDGRTWQIDELWIESASFEPVEGASGVWQATIFIKGRPGQKWHDKTPLYGYSELVGGVRVDITQKDSEGKDVPVARPHPLNLNGTKKPSPTDAPDEETLVPFVSSVWAGVPLA